MQIELQLEADNFLATTRNFIKSIPICSAQSFPAMGQTLYIDKVTVTDTTVLSQESFFPSINTSNGAQAVPGLRPIVKQGVDIKLVTENGLLSSGVNEANAFETGNVDLLLSLTVLLDSNSEPFMRVKFEGIDFKLFSGLIDSDTKNIIEDLVRDHFDQEDRAIDTSSISDMVEGVNISITNAGVATNAAGSALFIRLEINGDGNQLTQWENFFNNGVTNRMGSRQWALIFDKDLLEDSIRIRVENQLEETDKFSLDSNVSVNWSWITGAKFNVSFSGEVIDACICFFSEIDVDTDIFTTVTLSVPQDNVMRTHMYTTYDADDGEVFCCALTAGLFWPVVGIIYMADEDNPTNFGHYILGILFAFWVPMIGVAVGAGTESTSKYFDDIDEGCTKVNDEEVRCDQDLDLNFGVGGVFTATTLQAIQQGPVLSGTISAIAETSWGSFTLTDGNIGWHITGSCTGGGFGIEQSGGTVFQHFGAVVLCSYNAINDPQNTFANIQLEDLGAGATNIAVYPNPNEAYLNNPYDCLIRIVTNVGIRIVNLGKAVVLSEEEQQALQMKAMLAEANCPLMIQIFPWQFLKEWLPDPPPDEEQIWEEIWQVVVTEMTQEETLSIIDEKGQVWAEGVATKFGTAQLSVFRENMNVKSTLTIQGNISKEGSAQVMRSMQKEGVKRKILLKQLQLLPKAQIAINGNFKSVSIDRSRDGYLLSVTSDKAIDRYSISKYQTGRVMKKLSAINNATDVKYDFMGREWQMRTHARNTFSTISTYDVKRYGNMLLLRDAQEIHIADDMNRHKIVSVGAQPGMIRNAQFVRFYGLKNALYIDGADKSSAVYDYSSGSDLKKLTTYYHRPWFDHSARIDSIFVRLSDDGKMLNIYSIDVVKEI